jgi:hypothetical protein
MIYSDEINQIKSFPIVGLNMFSLPTMALQFPNKIVIWYLRNLTNTHYNSEWKLTFILSVSFFARTKLSEQ